MGRLAWSDSYSVGIAMFDAEHQKLIAIINDFDSALLEPQTPDILIRACDGLIEYAMLHLRHEEMYFEDWDYPGKEAHLRAHKAMRHQAFSYRDKILAEPGQARILVQELKDFLLHWLVGHIQTQDKRFCEFLLQKGFRETADKR
jgi:hemerythrin-like metal-binding domain